MTTPTITLRNAMEKLETLLDKEYVAGQIFYEADVVSLVSDHLRRFLRNKKGW